MAKYYLDRGSISSAVKNLRGTADAMLKVWLTLKQKGLTEEQSVTINTTNSEAELARLFDYFAADRAKKFFVPFAKTRSELTLAHDAARSHIQTNIKKFLDGTVGFDPRAFLKIEQNLESAYVVGTQESYPSGLGLGKNGFAKGDGQRVAMPIRAWAVWYFRTVGVESGSAPTDQQLVRAMLDALCIDEAEKTVVFSEDLSFTPHFQQSPISEDELREILTTSIDDDGLNTEAAQKTYALDERTYQRRLSAVRTTVTGPRWTAIDPLQTLQDALKLSTAVLLYGPPRTGKTRAVRQLYPDATIIQIYDGWGYDNLIVGMKSVGEGRFDWVDGPLLKAIREGKKVIVLEEVNRTQLSQALGDVFSLLEPAYRGPEKALTLRNGASFYIPKETIFIFTMNTLDTSTEEMDDALLGRMAGIEFPPRVEDLKSLLVEKGIPEKTIYGEVCS